MVIVHIYNYMSVVDIDATLPDSFLRNIIEFAGGLLAAPVFMFSMGFGMMHTQHNSPEYIYPKSQVTFEATRLSKRSKRQATPLSPYCGLRNSFSGPRCSSLSEHRI